MLRTSTARQVNRHIDGHESAIEKIVWLRWLVLLLAGHPHLIAAIYVYTQLGQTVAIITAVIGEAIQWIGWTMTAWPVASFGPIGALCRAYARLALGFGIKRKFPDEYFEAHRRNFAHPADLTKEYLSGPILGLPRFQGDNRIAYKIRPGVGRSLHEIDDKVFKALASNYPGVISFAITHHKGGALKGGEHKALFVAVLKEPADHTDQPIAGDIPKPDYKQTAKKGI